MKTLSIVRRLGTHLGLWRGGGAGGGAWGGVDDVPMPRTLSRQIGLRGSGWYVFHINLLREKRINEKTKISQNKKLQKLRRKYDYDRIRKKKKKKLNITRNKEIKRGREKKERFSKMKKKKKQ